MKTLSKGGSIITRLVLHNFHHSGVYARNSLHMYELDINELLTRLITCLQWLVEINSFVIWTLYMYHHHHHCLSRQARRSMSKSYHESAILTPPPPPSLFLWLSIVVLANDDQKRETKKRNADFWNWRKWTRLNILEYARMHKKAQLHEEEIIKEK